MGSNPTSASTGILTSPLSVAWLQQIIRMIGQVGRPVIMYVYSRLVSGLASALQLRSLS